MTTRVPIPGSVVAGPRTRRVPRRWRRGALGTGRADLHVHSCWSDGAQRPDLLVRAAAGHLNVLAVTDHDEIRGAFEARRFARANPQLGVEVVIGEEISTLNGHLIGLYLQECIPPRLSAAHTIDLIHAQGGLAVAAHPFHPVRGTVRGHPTVAQLIPDLPLDAVEIVNNAGVFSWFYDAWAALANVDWALPVTGGSDAHDVWYLGNALTRFAGRSAEDLRQALLCGVTRAHRDWSWTFDKLPRHLRLQTRALVRFLVLCRQRRHVASAP